MCSLKMVCVTKEFQDGTRSLHAVQDVSLSVAPGEVVMIMGPSGSGKTTLLSLAGCVMTPSAGSVVVGGIESTNLSEAEMSRIRLHSIGFVFQSFNLIPPFTALENTMLPLLLAGRSRRQAEARARTLLERLGLGQRLNHLPATLSGGEKQRVAVARALANDPPLILADEPTANLDSKTGAEVANLFAEAARNLNKAVLLVTHDRRLLPIATRHLWMEDGRLEVMTYAQD